MVFWLGFTGAIIALVGWFAFDSSVAVFIGAGLYLLETLLEWKNLNFNAKKLDITIVIIGCIIGLFVESAPWYICGLLAINIYSLIISVGSIVFISFLGRGKSEKGIDSISFLSMVVSILATVSYGLMFSHQWLFLAFIIAGVLSIILPVIAETHRITHGNKGKWMEIVAIIIGGFNFYCIIFALTEISIFIGYLGWIVCAVVYTIVGKKLKNRQPIHSSEYGSSPIHKEQTMYIPSNPDISDDPEQPTGTHNSIVLDEQQAHVDDVQPDEPELAVAPPVYTPHVNEKPVIKSISAPQQPPADTQKKAYSPYVTPEKKSTKTTMWLIVALIVACLVIVVLCVVMFTRNIDHGVQTESNTEETVQTTPESQLPEPTGDELLASAAESVLCLEVYNEQGEFIGNASGFLLNSELTLVTNYHVVQDAYQIVAWTEDNQSVEASTLLAYDEVADLAVLCCDTSLGREPLILADSDDVKQGMSVYAMGYPLGLANTMSDGIISARYIDEYGNDILQTTAAISDGNSGGPLLNEDGQVIGVMCAYYVDGQNLNVAVASNTLNDLLSQKNNAIKLADWISRPSMLSDCTHSFGEWVVDQEPTCTDTGREIRVCSLCGETETSELPATGHTIVTTPEVCPTCTIEGATEGSRCEICNVILSGCTPLPATGHRAIPVPAVPANCTNEGATEGTRCEFCNAILSGCTPLLATGHDYQNYVCSKCGANDPDKPTIIGDPLNGTWEAYYWGYDGATLERVDVFFFSNGQFQFLQDMPFEENDKTHGGTYTFDGTTITFYVTSGDAPSSSYTLTISSIGSSGGGTFFVTSAGQYFWKI